MLARNRTSQFARALRKLGLEVLEHVELGVERLPTAHVPAVPALPEEGLAARHALDVVDRRAARLQHLELGLAEVVTDRPDDPHRVEERGGEREVGGGAAQHSLALAERRLDGVEGDRSNDGDGSRNHLERLPQAGGLAELGGDVRALPGEIRVVAAEVAVGGGLLVDRAVEVEPLAERAGRRSKCSLTSVSICSCETPSASVPKVSTITDTGRATPIA